MQPDVVNSNSVKPTQEEPVDHLTNSTHVNPNSPNIAKHAHRFIFGYLVLIVLVAGTVGVYEWQHKKVDTLTTKVSNLQKQVSTLKSSQGNNSSTSTTNSNSAVPESSYSTINGTKYLIIKEWNVKLALTSPIDDATYTLVTNNTYISPAVFLSTPTMDASQNCVNYYKQGTAANNPMPSFQDIQQLTLSQTTTDMIGGGSNVTAQKAASTSPSTFVKVGNYVYYFGHGNGMPCTEQTSNILPAFETAFSTISAEN